MSSDKFYLTKDEQIFLMEWLEIDDPEEAVTKFASLMMEEGVRIDHLQESLKKVMKRVNKK